MEMTIQKLSATWWRGDRFIEVFCKILLYNYFRTFDNWPLNRRCRPLIIAGKGGRLYKG